MLSIHLDNMRSYLAKFDPSQRLVVGNRLHGAGGVMVSPWGFLLSRGAAQNLIFKWNGPADKMRQIIANQSFLRQNGGSTDYVFGTVLNQLGAEFVDTRDEQER